MSTLAFPKGFEWSTATAAHQIEGSNRNNDWWMWEHAPGTSCVEPSGDACDSWLRWDRDVAVLGELGFDGYRFSVEWSRIEPEAGEFSNAALDNYARLCEALLTVGVQPTITLHHFTTPRWAVESGGWTSNECAKRFGEFAHRVASRLDGLAARYCTLNEPNMVAAMGYLMGLFPPGGANDRASHDSAVTNLIAAHRGAVDAVRAATPDTPVGITVSMMNYQVGEGGEAAAAEAEAFEDVFLDATAGDDFIGVQTYSRMVMGPHGWVGPLPGVPIVETMGYERWPQALGACIRRAWDRTGGQLPILVTENGVATADDSERITFVHEALQSVHDCIADGIDVRGYTYWSLLDNFEWAFGYVPQFGIVEVDRATFERTPKPSARWLAKTIAANAIPQSL
ncbi:MAG: family 1 glycosylhydrolase [Acidimicrobiia bacterium]